MEKDTPVRTQRRLLWYAAGLVWFAGGYCLITRIHFVYGYSVTAAIRTPWFGLVVLAVLAAVLVRGALGPNATAPYAHIGWLLSPLIIPLLELLRGTYPGLPRTFLEVYFFVYVTWRAAIGLLRPPQEGSDIPPADGSPNPTYTRAAVGMVMLFWLYWFWRSHSAYNDYLLGYGDMGNYVRAVVNTWDGRGFLYVSEWPLFWDHFNVGLVLLVPFWALWQDVHFFFALQAACLALPALFIYAAARRLHSDPRAALCWSGVYLVFPAIGQINLNYSYGWHPVSLALPLLTAGLYALICRRRVTALICFAIACSFKESVFVVFIGLVFSLAALHWLHGRGRLTIGIGAIESLFRSRTWILIGMLCGGTLYVLGTIYEFDDTSRGRIFSIDGRAPFDMLLSPIRDPRFFWGKILAPAGWMYFLALVIPLGLRLLATGWRFLIPIVFPFGVLLVWGTGPATSLAFQYATTLVPFLMLAAITGAAAMAARGHATFRCWSVCALVAATTASLFIGALPWSQQTSEFEVPSFMREQWTHRNGLRDNAVALVHGKQATVLATHRLAGHVLEVKKINPIHNSPGEWRVQLLEQTGPPSDRRAWIDQFEWVILDLEDRNLQNPITTSITALTAEEQGYILVYAREGVLVYRRGDAGDMVDPQLLAPFRMDPKTIDQPLQQGEKSYDRYDVRVRMKLEHNANTATPFIRVRILWKALRDNPPDVEFRIVATDSGGGLIADSGIRLPLEGNRPTSWWKQDESYGESINLDVPKSRLGEGFNLHFIHRPAYVRNSKGQ